jgi:YbbR domain-containing protein
MKIKAVTISLIILFSLILWGSVSLNGEFVATVKVPIVFTNIPDGYTVGQTSISEINMNVKGAGWDILSLIFSRDNEFVVPVGRVFGKHEVSIKNSLNRNSRMVAALNVLDIYPDKVEFNVERIASKTVKVLPDVSLNYKEGFGLVSDIKVEPESLVVYGPESKIKQLQFIKARPVSFDNLEQKITKNLTFDKPDNIDFSTEDVKVEFDVQKITEKTFDNIVVEHRGVPSAKELLIIPAKISVVLRGGINILGKLSSSDIKAYVNFDDALKDNSGSINPVIVVPNNTKIIDVKPKKLDYIIKHY